VATGDVGDSRSRVNSGGDFMRTTAEDLNLRVVVRRVTTGSAPYRWEVHETGTLLPLHTSSQRFRSMETAFKAGQTGLADFIFSRRPEYPKRSRWRKATENQLGCIAV
jgi:hypothetical protein